MGRRASLKKFWLSALGLSERDRTSGLPAAPREPHSPGGEAIGGTTPSEPVHRGDAARFEAGEPEIAEPAAEVESVALADTWYHDNNPVYKVRRPLSLPMLLMSKGFSGSVSRDFLTIVTDVDQSDALPHDVVVQERLDISDFEIGEKLGAGAFASVARCKKKSTGEDFAIKRLKKSEYAYRPSIEASLPRHEHDTLILSRRHPNVSSLECAFETRQEWILIMEFCDQGSLRSLLKRDGKPGLEFTEATRLASQVLEGIGYLHSKSILHRDVKPENIGISSKPELKTAKLIDFGFAARVPGCQSRSVFGSYGYLAPEIEVARARVGPLREADDEHTYDNRVDLYSFGITLFVMMVGSEATSQGKLWTHSAFRKMLKDAKHKLWICPEYTRRGINAAAILPKLEECGAIDSISALTATDADQRPANAAEALKTRLFTQRGRARRSLV
jgi:serine/threonine protein kinase